MPPVARRNYRTCWDCARETRGRRYTKPTPGSQIPDHAAHLYEGFTRVGESYIRTPPPVATDRHGSLTGTGEPGPLTQLDSSEQMGRSTEPGDEGRGAAQEPTNME